MNILILSAGTRNKIIQYFRNALHGIGKVVATDAQITAPAIYDADSYYIVPRISDPNYIDIILDICRKESIKTIFSLIDPELSLLAKNEPRFEEIGVSISGSSYELCERALNKMQMYRWLNSKGYNCAKSYDSLTDFLGDLDAGIVSFPVFVKPINGSASINITKVNDEESLRFFWKQSDGLMIQEFLNGTEIGADVYIDTLSKKVVSIFTKKKILMRSGETDKAVSFKDPDLFELIERFCLESGFTAQIDIDLFYISGKYYISEVNPRFGGGYPFAHECGCDHIKLIINNSNGIVNEKNIGNYKDNVLLMKYNEILAKRVES